MKSKKLSICFSSLAGIVLIAAILVLVNIIFKPLNARMDCTADKLYTLSEGTKETLKGLTDTVSIRFYYSKDVAKMPVYFKNYAMRVEDLLQEYKQVAGKRLEIKKLNPKPDTDAEDSANLDGISGKSLDVFGDEQIYLGLAVSCGNRTEAIPFLSPDREKLLEYDLTRAIVGVKSAKKPKVGVISALKIMGGYDNPMAMMQGNARPNPAWIVISELKRTYEVVELGMDVKSVPDDISAVLLIHPKQMADTAMFALDQYVLRGGHLIAFLDPMSVADMQSQNPQMQQYAPPSMDSSLPPLLKAGGVEFDGKAVFFVRREIPQGNYAGDPPLRRFFRQPLHRTVDLDVLKLRVRIMGQKRRRRPIPVLGPGNLDAQVLQCDRCGIDNQNRPAVGPERGALPVDHAGTGNRQRPLVFTRRQDKITCASIKFFLN